MKRTTVWKILGAALIVAGITAALALTQQWHRAVWLHHGPMGYIAHELDLSDIQKSQIKSIWDGECPNVGNLMHELATEQREMDALTFHGAPDEGRVQDIAARQGGTFAKLFAEKEAIANKIYFQVLTPTQRTKADELLKHWNSRLDDIADDVGNTSRKK